MQALKKQLKQNLPLFIFTALLSVQPWALAESVGQVPEKPANAHEQHQDMDHSAHTSFKDEVAGFHGIFYGYLPCSDCDGIKTTLSLKQNNNYMIVSQPARESSREFYEKGKYNWDDATRTLILTSNKDATKRQFRIEDEGIIIQVNNDGTPTLGDQESYTLRRSDMVKSRQVHIH